MATLKPIHALRRGLPSSAPAWPAPAQAQDKPDNWLTRFFQPPATAAVPAPAGGAREWSGQAGASGHPLMTAEAIRAAAADFGNCIAALWPQAERRGVSRANFARYTAGLTPDLSIMDLLDAQPEFNKSTWDYLDALVSDERIARGRELLAQYAPVFAAAERAYGVDRHIIAAIWGVESNYGTMGGERSVLRSTATLACVGRRRDYFREEFLSALDILQRGDVAPDRLIGSWAGAFGPTQFMPTTFKRFAVDFDGDGRRDVVGSVADVIASTANNLKTDGWASGERWGYEVVLPPQFDYLLADPARQMTLAQWQTLGIRRADAKAVPAPVRARLFAAAGGGARARLPDAGKFPRHHEIQSGGSLRARHRASRRPARRRRTVRAELAARRARADHRRAVRAAAASGATRLRRRRARRASRPAHARSPSAISSSRPGRFPTALPRASCSTACASRNRRGHISSPPYCVV